MENKVDFQEAKAVIENILFVAGTPVSVERFVELFGKEISKDEILEMIRQIQLDYENRPLAVAEVAEGWRLQTRPEYSAWITQFFKMEKGQKLGRAALEVLAIIAYRQPITRAEIDEIRGVDSGGPIKGLVDKSLVRPMGRRKAPGKPMMYGTTRRFLEYFGLASLTDLPTLEEFRKELDEAFGERSPQQALDFVSGGAETPSEDSSDYVESAADTVVENAEEGGVTEDGIAVIQRGFDPDDDESSGLDDEPEGDEMGEGDPMDEELEEETLTRGEGLPPEDNDANR